LHTTGHEITHDNFICKILKQIYIFPASAHNPSGSRFYAA
jgi:hypothetical protein